MTITIREPDDERLPLIEEALRPYEAQRPEAILIDLYRRNSISVRIRIIDPSFQGMEKSERHSRVWEYLEKLPEDVQSDISMVVLLTPEEVKHSLANLEFEQPSPSLIQ